VGANETDRILNGAGLYIRHCKTANAHLKRQPNTANHLEVGLDGLDYSRTPKRTPKRDYQEPNIFLS
jgi:hypothetical protein